MSEDYSLAMVLSLSLKGFAGGCIGASNETLICKYLPEHLNPPACMHAEEILEFLPDGTVAWGESQTRINNVNVLNGVLCKWTMEGHETGIDRFWMIKTLEQPPTFNVYGLQLKTGRKDMETEPGILATQRAYDKVTFMDDTCIAGVLAKAERGFSILMPALRRAFPDAVFNIGSMTFYTTKASATNAATKFGNANTEHRASLLVKNADLKKNIFNRSQQSKIPWYILAGTDWLRTALPASIASLAL